MRSRFDCPSASLSLRSLLQRMQAAVWTGLVLALAAHLGISQVRGSSQAQKTARPLTTQFIKRQPRLTKPLELKKRPQPKRRQMHRKMVAVKAKVDRRRVSSSMRTTDVVRRLARPEVELERFTRLGSTGFEPQTIAEAIVGSKEAKQTMDMSLELLDIHALDTGRYHAMVIQDPIDKRNIKGFCHLATVYVERMYDIHFIEGTGSRASLEMIVVKVIRALSRALNEYTQMQADARKRLTLGDAEMYRTPWILLYSLCARYELSDYELESLGRYMMAGGLLFADTHPYHAYNIIESHKNNILAAIESQGVVSSPERLPNSHPVYHCYFDFDGPPGGSDGQLLGHGATPTYYIRDHLDGITVDERLLAILSDKGYVAPWYYWYLGTRDCTREVQFGVNMIIFSLVQEGSITHQVMDNVAY